MINSIDNLEGYCINEMCNRSECASIYEDLLSLVHSIPVYTEADTEHWPVSDWQYDVANGDTKLGYVDWVMHNKEKE